MCTVFCFDSLFSTLTDDDDDYYDDYDDCSHNYYDNRMYYDDENSVVTADGELENIGQWRFDLCQEPTLLQHLSTISIQKCEVFWK